jgi:hypothetical protein
LANNAMARDGFDASESSGKTFGSRMPDPGWGGAR